MIYTADLIHALETFPPNSPICAAMRGEVASLAIYNPSGTKIIAFVDAADNEVVEPVRVIPNPVPPL